MEGSAITYCEQDRFEDPSPHGRTVMITAPEVLRDVDHDLAENPRNLINAPLIGRTGILPSLSTIERTLARFLGAVRLPAGVVSRKREIADAEKSSGKSIQTVIQRREGGGWLIEMSIDSDADPEQIVTDVLVEIRRLRSEYGDMASLIVVNKRDPYGLLPMLLPGQLATYSLAGDLTPKKYVEFWESMLAADDVFKSGSLHELFRKVQYFAQVGLLCAATQPAFHLHPTEILTLTKEEKAHHEKYKEVIERLSNGQFGAPYLAEVIDEIYIEKFSRFEHLIHTDLIAKIAATEEKGAQRSFALLTSFLELYHRFKKGIIDRSTLIAELEKRDSADLIFTIAYLQHLSLCDKSNEQLKHLIHGIEDFFRFQVGDKKEGILSRKEKKELWLTGVTVEFPRARLMISSAFMRAVKDDLDRAIQEKMAAIPMSARQRITVEVSERFNHKFPTPGIRIHGNAHDIGLYTQELSAACDAIFNKKWNELFEIMSAIVELPPGNGDHRKNLFDKLRDALCLANVMDDARIDGVFFEEKPGFYLRKGEDILGDEIVNKAKAENNYLEYLLQCFGYAKGKNKPEMHNKKVCPRSVVIERQKGDSFTFLTSPGLVFEPVADEEFLQATLADVGTLKHCDGRLVRLKDGTVAKRVGGDGSTHDFFMRRNKTRPYPHEGNYVFTKLRDLFNRIGNKKALKPFFIHYARKAFSQVLLHPEGNLWLVVSSVIDEITNEELHGLFEPKMKIVPSLRQKLQYVVQGRILLDGTAVSVGQISQCFRDARLNTEEKFRTAEDGLFSGDTMRSVITDNIEGVRQMLHAIKPELCSQNGASSLEPRLFFQLAFEGANRAVMAHEFKPANGGDNVVDTVAKRYVKRGNYKKVRQGNLQKKLSHQFQCFLFAKYVVEHSFKDVLVAREELGSSEDHINVRAKFFLIEEISHIIEVMITRERKGNLIQNIIEKGDQGEFNRLINDIALKLRKRGYDDEFYHGMLPGKQRDIQGNVDMIRQCPFDPVILRDSCRINDPQKVRDMIKLAVAEVHRVIDSGSGS